VYLEDLLGERARLALYTLSLRDRHLGNGGVKVQVGALQPVDGLRELEDLLVARVRLRLGLPELAQLPALAVVSHADDEGKASQRRQHGDLSSTP